MTSITSPDDTTSSELLSLLASWQRALRAQRMSPTTLETYAAAVTGLDAFLAERGMPQAVMAISREHVEAFITHLLETRAPATAHNRYRALRSFFGWLVEEGEITTSPMARMKPPRLPETPPRVLKEPEIRRLLEVCGRDKSFNGKRDEAIIRVVADTGVRRGDLLGLSLDDIDLDEGLLRVTGKGDRSRLVVVGASSVRSLDRYLRARAKRPEAAELTAVWLGRKGPLRESGLAERGMPQAIVAITREHVEAFITHLLETRAPATAHNRYRALRSFFAWLVEEGEITSSPMARMKPPRLSETPPRVLREAEIGRLLEVCGRDKSFNGKRDEAIIRVFADTGVRRGELLGLTLDDIDLDEGLLRVTGKGDRTRMVAVGASSVRSLDRYLRARTKRPEAAEPVSYTHLTLPTTPY